MCECNLHSTRKSALCSIMSVNYNSKPMFAADDYPSFELWGYSCLQIIYTSKLKYIQHKYIHTHIHTSYIHTCIHIHKNTYHSRKLWHISNYMLCNKGTYNTESLSVTHPHTHTHTHIYIYIYTDLECRHGALSAAVTYDSVEVEGIQVLLHLLPWKFTRYG